MAHIPLSVWAVVYFTMGIYITLGFQVLFIELDKWLRDLKYKHIPEELYILFTHPYYGLNFYTQDMFTVDIAASNEPQSGLI